MLRRKKPRQRRDSAGERKTTGGESEEEGGQGEEENDRGLREKQRGGGLERVASCLAQIVCLGRRVTKCGWNIGLLWLCLAALP